MVRYLYLNVKRFISDTDSLDEIKIINDTNTLRNYKLVMKVDKNIKNDTILLNNAEYSLNSNKYKNDEKYNYYIIADGNLVADTVVYNIEFDKLYEGISYEIVETKNI